MDEPCKEYQEGQASYASDELIECPYGVGTDEYRNWQNGWWDAHYSAMNNYNF